MTKVRRRDGKQTTIKEVAQAAGVSVTTVSNVLNGRTAEMAGTTLLRVQQAIRELNYRPNNVARSLVTQRTASFGVIIAEIDTPLFLQALNSIETIARRENYNILLCTAKNLADEQEAVNLLLEKQVDGFIFLSTSAYVANDYLLDLAPVLPPTVLVNRTVTAGTFHRIELDDTAGVIEAIDYLVGLGHRHIAHLHGPKSRRSTDRRMEGYRLGLARHNLPFDETYVRSGDYEAGRELWQQSTLALLDLLPRPTAIIAANDLVATVVLRTIRRAGLRAPQDISVIGNDDQPFCAYLDPTLTTVQLPIVAAGQQAVELLLAQIRGEAAADQVTLPCPLIVRESSGPVAD
jgi:LacI family transcriptional regulator